MKYPSDIVFTPSVKKIQKEKGSRNNYSRMEKYGAWNTEVTPDLKAFLSKIDSFYFGTSNSEGQPYIQHRGGDKGFLKAIDDEHLGFADFSGNMQYISVGNLSENDKATIFLMHYPSQSRIKIWGTAKISNDRNIIELLTDNFYKARVERAIIFKVKAWDMNCRQHIKQRFTAEDIEKITQPLNQKINELETIIKNISNSKTITL
ncbi:pyridoxamine 5'-phosphate oxidase family protein [Pontimicrobium aquaticum]|uniref:Pyridoxamine 5'-phosphate oxidase n=1 Tax=Pontimicrobium aquaticum TaxID=2565367 RepID=A0A4U0EVJ0_9FLAO|nr:pyridoxamine 5'-phosphate oxidase family protein [Pontimicrobium aquaticum]TJY35947.1 pyridoxamine 5'-phosphate oxidase [Pontimicrobium aquaticum]